MLVSQIMLAPFRVNPLQLLNTISAEKQPSCCKGFMYVTTQVNDRDVHAMLDTSATNNFVARREADKLGLNLSDIISQIKVVNSGAIPVHGVVETTLKLAKLPKKLPPKRTSDDNIELKPEAKPPTKGPYRMTLCELTELRRYFPDFEKPFKVHIDASDKTLGVVLVQETQPIAFESIKLKDAEQRYFAHEKEMTAVTHKKLTLKQAHWQVFLAKFDFVWVHRLGHENQVVDALSRKKCRAMLLLTSIAGVAESSRAQQKRALPVIRKEFDKQVEKILNHQSVSESKLNRMTISSAVEM
ncbi:hypothetical protein JRO89_XS03G0101300 [Xanthoceras sorbifolium]|uniref:Reverse transcriptase/retrotransposon-derived protein RNase H-like domain-containing protein n=1 Tax=Xanthoceras sorbifolium TaxID=99658 RepID=A0ABQ8I9G6_9ROSI|nr:hypothetical protein JRO89_XS03G0101300 [Xanthoceras sorbifolium]